MNVLSRLVETQGLCVATNRAGFGRLSVGGCDTLVSNLDALDGHRIAV